MKIVFGFKELDGVRERRILQKLGLFRKLLVSLFLLFCFSGNVKAGEQPVQLLLWNIPNKFVQNPEERAARAVYVDFIKTHPHIEIISGSGLAMEGPAAGSGFLMAMAAGNAPDIVYVNFRQAGVFIDQNFLYPLDDYIQKWGKEHEMHPIVKEALNRDGHVYAVPFASSTMGLLLYRRDFFKEAGLDPDKPPQNWDELYEYAQRLTIPEKGQYGLGLPSGNAGPYYFTPFVWQAGGEMVSKDEGGKWKVVFNEDPGVKALEFYKKLKWDRWQRDGKEYQGVVYAGSDASDVELLKKGKVSMSFGGASGNFVGPTEFDPNLVGVSYVPAGPKGIKASLLNAACLGINATIRDKRKRDAAWEYIEHITSDRAARISTEVYVETGLARFVQPDHLIKFGYSNYIEEIPETWTKAYKDLFKYGKPEPYAPNYNVVQTTELIAPIDKVLLYKNTDPKQVLDECAHRANETILGYRQPEVMTKKRKIAALIMALIAIAVGFCFVNAIKLYAQKYSLNKVTKEAKLTKTKTGYSIHIPAWLFMFPALTAILVWGYYPLIRGLLMAFMDYNILGDSKFVGLDNFINAVSQPLFWKAVKNTFIYVSLSLGMGFFIPLVLALLLAEVPKGKVLFRTIFYLPAITSSLVIMLLWKLFYDQSPMGLFNRLLSFLQFPIQSWLQDPKWAMVCVIIPGIWAGAGPGSIIYLAAMQSIPDIYYESADMDGASTWHKIWNVTIPYLKPLIIINFVGAFIGSFHAMENVFVMTGGGPLHATHILGVEIFIDAFVYLKFGYATAIAWILGSFLIGFTLYQLKILKDLKFTTAK